MAWFRLQLEVGEERVSVAETLLADLGAASVTITDAGSEPIVEPDPGTSPRWRNCRLQALFPVAVSFAALREAIAAADLEPVNMITDFLEDEDWVNAWKQFAPVRCFANRLWIAPRESPLPAQAAGGAVLRLDPGLAFGSGSHPSTRLCLGWLAREPLAGRRVLDYGCGSGILGLAMCCLGAGEVYAVDHDPQALLATRGNAASNQFHDEQMKVGGKELLRDVAPFDLVVANILANPLIELAPALTGLTQTGGMIVLSGILEHQVDAVMRAYPLMDFADPALEEDEHGAIWAALQARKRDSVIGPED